MIRRNVTFTVRTENAGGPLIDFLAARFTYHSREEWSRLIADGSVTAPDFRRLSVGDVICYTPKDIPEPPVDFSCRILHEDDLIAVVSKSGDLPCHPGGRYFNHTLWALLKEKHGISDPIFVNRLDRETSGIMLIAKTVEAEKNLRSQFASNRVNKTYTAFVSGVVSEPGRAVGNLGTDPDSLIRKKQKFTAEPNGTSETAWEPVAVHGDITELKVHPKTGRLHQIRATLLACGLPIIGDKLYGADETLFLRFCQSTLTEADRAVLRISRQALHAAELSFRHPAFGRPVTFTAPLPDDLQTLQKKEPQ